MNPKLTDDHVAGLPLHLGRADLLEEIMSSPVLDERPVRDERPRRRTTSWLVPAAAAVVVAALAVGSAWWASGGPSTGPSSDRSGGYASQPTAGKSGDSVLLDAPGWAVTAMYADKTSGEMTYEKGSQSLEVMWGDADSYQGYVEDRRHIVRPPADGEPITVLGKAAQMWPYSADDHTAIRELEGDRWIELRGEGMDKDAYLALLGRLDLVDETTFEATLPDSFVRSDERSAEIDKILDGIGEVAHPLLPDGVDRASITSDQNDDYQLGAEISGAVACAWLDEFADARQAGDQGRADQAAAVLETSHDWPVLHQMDARGDYPEVLWQLADQAAAGQLPDWYAGGLGCNDK
jgi:hypothetical protein